MEYGETIFSKKEFVRQTGIYRTNYADRLELNQAERIFHRMVKLA